MGLEMGCSLKTPAGLGKKVQTHWNYWFSLRSSETNHIDSLRQLKMVHHILFQSYHDPCEPEG